MTQVRAIKKTGRYRDVLVFKPASPFDRRTSYDYKGITVRLFPFLQMPSLILNGLTNGINSALFLKAFRRAGFSPGPYRRGARPHLRICGVRTFPESRLSTDRGTGPAS